MKSFTSLVPFVVLVGFLFGINHAAAETTKDELREAHESWFSGILNEDTSFLERFLAEDITLGFGATLMPRNDYLKYFSSGELFYDEAEHLETHFRIYGKAGLVTGWSNLKYRFQGNEGFERLHYVAVYVLTDSGWRMVAWQSAEEIN